MSRDQLSNDNVIRMYRWIRAGIGLSLLLMTSCAASAEDYRPPKGFNKNPFGAPLWAFVRPDDPEKMSDGLRAKRASALLALYADIIPYSGKVTFTDFSTPQTVQGQGKYMLARFTREADYVPYRGIRTMGNEYLFCSWGRVDVANTWLFDHLRLCGGIVHFATQTASYWDRAKGPTIAEAILSELIARHGKPVSYVPPVKVEITQDGELVPSRGNDPQRFHRYWWCPKSSFGISAYCESSIIMTLDPEIGEGTVVYATPPLYVAAQAIRDVANENDWLYEILSDAKKLNFRPPREPYQPLRVGTHLSGPKAIHLTGRELAALASEGGTK